MKVILRMLVLLSVSALALMLILLHYTKLEPSWKIKTAKLSEPRVMLAWNPYLDMPLWFWEKGNKGKRTLKEKCDSYTCVFTIEKNMLNKSSMVLFNLFGLLNPKSRLPPYRIENQPWVFAVWEPPINNHHTPSDHLQYIFNRSISYRKDSDRFQAYGFMEKMIETHVNTKSVPEIARGKNKLVVWFVSNCGAQPRKDYSTELRKHVSIDIFGGCGKPDPCRRDRNCTVKMRQKYKFCLAFENMRCIDYITEKYWFNVNTGCVPIVLGPTIENYNRLVPPDSFIHVDNFTSPKELASYIKYLDQNDEAYYKYHMWRHKYRTFYRDNDEVKITLCDFCSVLDAKPHKAYDIKEFWGREQACKLS